MTDSVGGDSLGGDESVIQSWQEFSSPSIFANLGNISEFALSVELPKAFRWVDTSSAHRVAGRVYDELREVLVAAGFYRLESLKLLVSDERVGARYEDDAFEFIVYFDSDGDLWLRRTGSSFERFHEWYTRLMPSVRGLVDRLLMAVADETKYDAEMKRELQPLRSQYRFKFVGYDFTKPPSKEIQRNVAILTRLVAALPDEAGHLSDGVGNTQLEDFGRLDFSISRWDRSGRSPAREVYTVEGPANRRRTSLWFDFGYVGETYESADGGREPFDPSAFLSEYEIPYVQFLRNRALSKFVSELTEGHVFLTTAGRLP
ncbi:MAG: hypothetical protein GY720_01935 [bacterium]|nr:hypothetical protein [bacterium]